MDAMKLMNKLLEGSNSVVDEPAMPEVILPCPLCGRAPKVNRGCGVVTCCEISVEDVAAWNSLPRALRWTHEPPKVAGFYFLKMDSGTMSMVYLSEQDIKDKDWHGCVGQWVSIAGPIPAPID